MDWSPRIEALLPSEMILSSWISPKTQRINQDRFDLAEKTSVVLCRSFVNEAKTHPLSLS